MRSLWFGMGVAALKLGTNRLKRVAQDWETKEIKGERRQKGTIYTASF